MPYPNVWVTLANPDALYEGTFPGVGFKVRKIHLAAFPSRADAEAGAGPTHLVTWDLICTTDTPPADHYGPYRYGFYDATSGPLRWYAYRFESDTLDLGPWSAPWRAQPQRPTLEQILGELPMALGDLVRAQPITAATTSTLTLPVLSEPGYSDDYFIHWHVGVKAAGVYQFSRIASYSGGTATVSPAFSAAPAPGSTAIISPLLSVEQMIQAVNLALEEMEGEAEIAIPANEPVLCPEGLTRSSLLRAYAVWPWDMREVPTRVTLSGMPLKITGLAPAWASAVNVVYLAPYSAIDGPLTNPDDTTSAPLPWVRAAAAAAIARMLTEQDPEDRMAQALFQRLAAKAKEAAGKWAPERRSSIATIQQRGGLPGPVPR